VNANETGDKVYDAQARALDALQALANSRPELTAVLADLTAVLAGELGRNARFAKRLSEVLLPDQGSKAVLLRGRGTKATPPPTAARRSRREPGPWDPYIVFAEFGEAGLRERLIALDLEQLRNIIAEHGMDTDRLAMKWRRPERVVNRIVDRVVERTAKGDGFRRP
jgi:hypothetical protein